MHHRNHSFRPIGGTTTTVPGTNTKNVSTTIKSGSLRPGSARISVKPNNSQRHLRISSAVASSSTSSSSSFGGLSATTEIKSQLKHHQQHAQQTYAYGVTPADYISRKYTPINSNNLAVSSTASTNSEGDSPIQSAISILRRAGKQYAESVRILQQYIGENNDNGEENFEQLVSTLNIAARLYLTQMKQSNIAASIASFAYETCVIERLPSSVLESVLLNYCQISKKNRDFDTTLDLIDKFFTLAAQTKAQEATESAAKTQQQAESKQAQSAQLTKNIAQMYAYQSAVFRKQDRIAEAIITGQNAVSESEKYCSMVFPGKSKLPASAVLSLAQSECVLGKAELLFQENEESQTSQQSQQSRYYQIGLKRIQKAIDHIEERFGLDHPHSLHFRKKLFLFTSDYARFAARSTPNHNHPFDSSNNNNPESEQYRITLSHDHDRLPEASASMGLDALNGAGGNSAGTNATATFSQSLGNSRQSSSNNIPRNETISINSYNNNTLGSSFMSNKSDQQGKKSNGYQQTRNHNNNNKNYSTNVHFMGNTQDTIRGNLIDPSHQIRHQFGQQLQHQNYMNHQWSSTGTPLLAHFHQHSQQSFQNAQSNRATNTHISDQNELDQLKVRVAYSKIAAMKQTNLTSTGLTPPASLSSNRNVTIEQFDAFGEKKRVREETGLLKEQVTALKDELQKCKNEHAIELEKQKESHDSIVESIQIRIDELQGKLFTVVADSARILEADKKTLTQQSELIQAELDRTKALLAEAIEKHAEKDRMLALTTQSLESHKAIEQSVSLSYKQQKETHEEHTKQFEAQLAQLQQLLLEEQENARLKDTQLIQIQEQHVILFTQTNSAHAEQIAEFQAKIDNHQREIESIYQKHESQISSLNSQISHTKNSNASATSELEAITADRNNLQSELTIALESMKQLRESLQAINSPTTDKKQNDTNEELNALHARIATLEGQLAQQTAQTSFHIAENHALTQQLEQTQIALETQQQQITEQKQFNNIANPMMNSTEGENSNSMKLCVIHVGILSNSSKQKSQKKQLVQQLSTSQYQQKKEAPPSDAASASESDSELNGSMTDLRNDLASQKDRKKSKMQSDGKPSSVLGDAEGIEGSSEVKKRMIPLAARAFTKNDLVKIHFDCSRKSLCASVQTNNDDAENDSRQSVHQLMLTSTSNNSNNNNAINPNKQNASLTSNSNSFGSKAGQESSIFVRVNPILIEIMFTARYYSMCINLLHEFAQKWLASATTSTVAATTSSSSSSGVPATQLLKTLQTPEVTSFQYQRVNLADRLEFSFAGIDMELYAGELKLTAAYVQGGQLRLLEQTMQRFMSRFAFTSQDTSDRRLKEIGAVPQGNRIVVSKRFVPFGERVITSKQVKESVEVRFYYDLVSKMLILESQDDNVSGIKIRVKRQDVPKWMVQHHLFVLDGCLRSIKVAHVKLLKSSIKRFLLWNRVYSTNINVKYQDQCVLGILTIFKGIQNSFVYIKTIGKEQNFRRFYAVPFAEHSFEKLVSISKHYITDSCKLSYSRGIEWIKSKERSLVQQGSSASEAQKTILKRGELVVTRAEINSIRQSLQRKIIHILEDEMLLARPIITNSNNPNALQLECDDDIIQIQVLQKNPRTLLLSTFWDLPIAAFEYTLLESEDPVSVATRLLAQATLHVDEVAKVFQLKVDGTRSDLKSNGSHSNNNNIQGSHQKQPTNIFLLDCLNVHLRNEVARLKSHNLRVIKVIDVPDHSRKKTTKLYLILNERSNEYLIRSVNKSVSEIKIPSHGNTVEKLLNNHYFYFDQNQIKFMKRNLVEKAIFQMRKFLVVCRLRYYQVLTDDNNYGSLVLFQGQKSTIVIIKIAYATGSATTSNNRNRNNNSNNMQISYLRKIFVIKRMNLEKILENINAVIASMNVRIKKMFTVLSYRQIENQEFEFFAVAALWDQKDNELILKADDLSIPQITIKKGKLSNKQALLQADEVLQSAIIFKNRKTGINSIDI